MRTMPIINVDTLRRVHDSLVACQREANEAGDKAQSEDKALASRYLMRSLALEKGVSIAKAILGVVIETYEEGLQRRSLFEQVQDYLDQESLRLRDDSEFELAKEMLCVNLEDYDDVLDLATHVERHFHASADVCAVTQWLLDAHQFLQAMQSMMEMIERLHEEAA